VTVQNHDDQGEATNVTDKQQLKLVVLYDRNRNEYFLDAHNQTPNQADSHVAELTPHLRPDCSYIVLVQTRRHRTEEAQDCRACRETVARSAHLEPQPKFKRRNEP
jgi:hypothetical protein